jgi:ribosomal RNA-processing protein 36
MSSTKRKAPGVELQRRVRVRRESSEEIESVASVNGDDPAEEVSQNSNTDSDSSSEEDEVCFYYGFQNELLANS